MFDWVWLATASVTLVTPLQPTVTPRGKASLLPMALWMRHSWNSKHITHVRKRHGQATLQGNPGYLGPALLADIASMPGWLFSTYYDCLSNRRGWPGCILALQNSLSSTFSFYSATSISDRVFRCISRTYPWELVDRSVPVLDFHSVGFCRPSQSEKLVRGPNTQIWIHKYISSQSCS